MSYLTEFKLQFTLGQQRYTLSNINYDINNYMLANGSIISQSTYPDLYSKVGLIIDGFDNWQAFTTPTFSGVIYATTYSNGLYVYAGSVGTLATSTDAITWTARTSGTTSDIDALIYDNGLYVYAGGGGVLATSTDAITWTARTSGTTSQINTLTYGNGLYVYAGAGGVLATSTDAITWTARTSGTGTFLFLNYGDGLYIGGGDAVSSFRTSTDGITWTTVGSGSAYGGYSLAYGNGLYVYIANSRTFKTSKYSYNSQADFILPTATSIFDNTLLATKTKTYIKL